MTKILLVEDDKSLREIYGVRLLAEGYDIISAGDGEEALALAIKERPSLIVSDVMMPKISGFDMLDILRSTTETKDIKVIMMTALSSEDQRKRGEQLGADRYLVKSQVGIEDVVRTVHEVLGDAPIANTAASPFATPAPSAQAAPIVAPQATTPPSTVAPATPGADRPVAAAVPPRPAPPAPFSPAPAPAPSSSLPQPTAPFSTPRPSSTNRIVEPITSTNGDPSSQGSFANRLEQELQGHTPQAAPHTAPSTPVPTPATAPQMPQAPQPAPVTAAPPAQVAPAAPPVANPLPPQQPILSPAAPQTPPSAAPTTPDQPYAS